MLDTLLLMIAIATSQSTHAPRQNLPSDATMTVICDALAADLGPGKIVVTIRGNDFVCE